MNSSPPSNRPPPHTQPRTEGAALLPRPELVACRCPMYMPNSALPLGVCWAEMAPNWLVGVRWARLLLGWTEGVPPIITLPAPSAVRSVTAVQVGGMQNVVR